MLSEEKGACCTVIGHTKLINTPAPVSVPIPVPALVPASVLVPVLVPVLVLVRVLVPVLVQVLALGLVIKQTHKDILECIRIHINHIN